MNYVKLCFTLIFLLPLTIFCQKTCKQIEDVTIDGQNYMQFVFVDNQGNYTAGYRESYDDPKKGSLFSSISPHTIVSKSTFALNQLDQFHTNSVRSMKQRAISSSPVTQRQAIDKLCFENKITPEQACLAYQQIENATL